MGFTPADHGGDGFVGVTLPVRGRREGPAHFRRLERRIDVALEVSEATLAHVAPTVFFLDGPETVALERPMAGIAQQAGPAFLARGRFAGDVADDDGIAPHGRERLKVLQLVPTQAQ